MSLNDLTVELLPTGPPVEPVKVKGVNLTRRQPSIHSKSYLINAMGEDKYAKV
jgi:hypothetical protein